MLIQMLKTRVAEDGLSYADLVRVDGQVKTIMMKKAAEPNVFVQDAVYDSDRLDELMPR